MYTSQIMFEEPPAGQKHGYCFKDAAGNITRGEYPENAITYSGCFADGTMSTVPNLTTYGPLLIARITGTPPQLGYGLSDSTRATQNDVFRTRLSQNVNTLITSQYVSDPIPSGGLILNTTQE
jgi:hypothetical protein